MTFVCAGTDSRPALDRHRLLRHGRGALLGAAIGDALGATVEFMTSQEIRARYGVHDKMRGGGWLYLKPGQITDDTEMSLCIARAVAEAGGWNVRRVAENFAHWLRTGPVDVGATCAQGIRRFMHSDELCVRPSKWHAGNGALMRMAPVAVASAGDDERLVLWALEQAHLTHNHPLSDAACVAVGRMVHAGLLGHSLWELRVIADALVSRHPEIRYRPYGGNSSGYVADTLATVFHHFFSTASFEACLTGVVNQGGDTDTNGCVAGMIAGAYYGEGALPERWLKKLHGPTREEIHALCGPLVAAGCGMGEVAGGATGRTGGTKAHTASDRRDRGTDCGPAPVSDSPPRLAVAAPPSLDPRGGCQGEPSAVGCLRGTAWSVPVRAGCRWP